MTDKFWILYANGESVRAHDTAQEAQKDAVRETELRGCPVFVLEAIGVAAPAKTVYSEIV